MKITKVETTTIEGNADEIRQAIYMHLRTKGIPEVDINDIVIKTKDGHVEGYSLKIVKTNEVGSNATGNLLSMPSPLLS